MKKFTKYFLATVALVCLFGFGTLLADKQKLGSELVRLHIVADSDSIDDQNIKLTVRDAVVAYLQDKMSDIANAEQAKAYIQEELETIEKIANDTIRLNGCDDIASVSLSRESFGPREYDTFSLPSGVYESLRIEIGSGEGRNWWCVVFPSLCVPAAAEGFTETAVSAGLGQGLVSTLSDDGEYKIRFYLLDCLGRLENFFFGI